MVCHVSPLTCMFFLFLTATWVGGGFILGIAEATYNPTLGAVWALMPVPYVLTFFLGKWHRCPKPKSLNSPPPNMHCRSKVLNRRKHNTRWEHVCLTSTPANPGKWKARLMMCDTKNSHSHTLGYIQTNI